MLDWAHITQDEQQHQSPISLEETERRQRDGTCKKTEGEAGGRKTVEKVLGKECSGELLLRPYVPLTTMPVS